jgi:hypothetical protein
MLIRSLGGKADTENLKFSALTSVRVQVPEGPLGKMKRDEGALYRVQDPHIILYAECGRYGFLDYFRKLFISSSFFFYLEAIMNKELTILQNQFQIAQMYAFYWYGMAITGAATLRKTEQGREPTEEEKAEGKTIGWRPHTPEEKTKIALETMARHIHRMNELSDEMFKYF